MERLEAAKTILETLNKAGYEAYIIGGYVRDQILGNETGDIDITTQAKPEIIEQLFKRTVLTGVKHGTVTVICDRYQFEVTTFRREGNYTDHRRPDEVVYVDTLEADVKRRDFTMNALAFDSNEQLIDYVDGRRDIEQKLIQTVGQAGNRFSEDALRMLRGFRFISKLGFTFSSDVKAAIKEHGHLIGHVAYERIMKEIDGLVKGEHFIQSLNAMIESSFYEHLPLFKEGIEMMAQYDFKPRHLSEFLAVCVLHHDEPVLERLPIANYIKSDVRLIVEMMTVGLTDFSSVIIFRNGLDACLSVNHINHVFKDLPDKKDDIKERFDHLPIRKQCDLAFKGDDIIRLYDKKPGGWIGEILDDICLKVLLGELPNDSKKIRQYLLKKQ